MQTGRIELFWPRQLVRKWLAFKTSGDDFNADRIDHDVLCPPESEDEGFQELPGKESDDLEEGHPQHPPVTQEMPESSATDKPGGLFRWQSETLRKQYVESKEYRVCVGSWNVAGKPPPHRLDLDEWLDTSQSADIYVFGFQEIVPLNAGNVLCIEDGGPAAKWEGLIREALNSRASPTVSNRSSPSSWHGRRSRSVSEISDSEIDRVMEGFPCGDEISSVLEPRVQSTDGQLRQNRVQISSKHGLKRTYGSSEISPSTWSRSSLSSSRGSTYFIDQDDSLETPLFSPEANKTSSSDESYETKSNYIRVASKQMVGVFITVWVKRELRRRIHNVKVSCVGCGLMGYLGNKGSVAVSMSLYQTSFCFICSHLQSGDKYGDELRRNFDVAEILRRTVFPRIKLSQLPDGILGHDQIIWLGDLNYRLAMQDDEARTLIATEKWDALLEKDQLKIEQRAGRVFDGWFEGPIYFAPTYKYNFNSDMYFGVGTKVGEKKRTPAWCDRILWRGQGLRLLSYDRSELKRSDHRPVHAVFVSVVERLSVHKLKRAITFSKVTPIVQADLSPHLKSLGSFRKAHFDEINIRGKYAGLRQEAYLSKGCMIGDDLERLSSHGLSQNMLSVF